LRLEVTQNLKNSISETLDYFKESFNIFWRF
jgi:hypothetical protein